MVATSSSGRAASAKRGGPLHGRPAWCFFAPANHRIVQLEGDGDGDSQQHLSPSSLENYPYADKSRFVLTTAKAEHRRALPSAKHDRALLDPADPRFEKVLATDSLGSVDLLTPVQRVEIQGLERLRRRFVPLNERKLCTRRERDSSRATLDNPYRQFTDKGQRKPLIAQLLEGQFYHPAPSQPAARTQFVAENKRNCRLASALLRHIRAGNDLPQAADW